MKRTKRPESELARTRPARNRIWVEQTPIVNFGKRKVENIMFIQTKVRGVPLYALAQSGLYPQINLLAQLWEQCGCGKNNKGNHGNTIKQAKPKIWLAIVIWLSWMGGIFIFFIGQGQGDVSKCGLFLSWLGWIFFAIDALTQPWDFAKAVRRLDECLKQQNSNGIAILPHDAQGFEAYLRDCMESWAWHVLYYEDTIGRDSNEAEIWRARRRTLRAIAAEFGFDLGKDDLYYDKAAAQLARGKEEREKASANPAPPVGT